MKVICIDAKPRVDETNLIEGNIYTVIRIIEPINVYEGYVLEEVKSGHFTGAFLSCRFISLSSIDELELLEQRHALLVTNL